MPRRAQEPDYDRVWNALAESDRAMIIATEEKLGVNWRSVPMLRTLAKSLATIELTRQWPELSETDALDLALEELGIEDNTDAATRPADSFARLLRKWRRTRCSDRARAGSNIL